MKHEPGQIYSTPEVEGQNPNPSFKYECVHNIDLVTDYIIDCLDSGSVSPFFALLIYHRLCSKCTLILSSRSRQKEWLTDPSPSLLLKKLLPPEAIKLNLMLHQQRRRSSKLKKHKGHRVPHVARHSDESDLQIYMYKISLK